MFQLQHIRPDIRRGVPCQHEHQHLYGSTGRLHDILPGVWEYEVTQTAVCVQPTVCGHRYVYSDALVHTLEQLNFRKLWYLLNIIYTHAISIRIITWTQTFLSICFVSAVKICFPGNKPMSCHIIESNRCKFGNFNKENLIYLILRKTHNCLKICVRHSKACMVQFIECCGTAPPVVQKSPL